MNTVVVVGRVGKDPDIKYYESGKVRTSFSVAVNRWDSKTKSEVTDWFNIEVWTNKLNLRENTLKRADLLQLMAEYKLTYTLMQQEPISNGTVLLLQI